MVTVRQSQFGIAITWIIVNTILMLAGAGIAVIGFLVTFSPEGLCFLYRNELREALAEIYTPTLASKCIDFGEIFGWEVKLTVIFFGAILFFFGLFAVATAVWPRAGALGLYIGIIAIYVVVLMTVLIVYFIAMDVTNNYSATDWVRDTANTTFIARYEGDDSFDDFTRLVNFIHRHYNCCGIDGMASFAHTENWDRGYTLPTAPDTPEVALTMNNLPMSCCIRDRMKDCIDDVRNNKLSGSWVMLGCFEGEMASDAESVAKYLAIALSVFTIFLAFSITLAFIICTPILAAKRRGPDDYKIATTATTVDDTTPQDGYNQPPPPIPPHPPGPPIPQQALPPIFVEDSVTRWHSQFGSRFYDNQIFKSYNKNNGNESDQRNSNINARNGNPPLPPRR